MYNIREWVVRPEFEVPSEFRPPAGETEFRFSNCRDAHQSTRTS